VSEYTSGADWHPTAPLANLKARAELLKRLRAFFAMRDVMEVSTPVLATAGVTDPFIDNFTSSFEHGTTGQDETLYLQTSPEYAMKRLLAAGCEHIYQIGPAFRHEGYGCYHNPEFTMLEWYRSGFDMPMLIAEVAELLKLTLDVPTVEVISYQQAFLQNTGLDPLKASKDEWLDYAKDKGLSLHGDINTLDKDDILQLVFATYIEPEFANASPVIVSHFPASQAALATINQDDPRTANRFEAYYQGIELANGFHELTDADEQRKRFINDNEKREALGLPNAKTDERFLAALNAGLPDCAGVALGVDRLLMLITQSDKISDVLPFAFPHN
jgi:lysyl-tRNA synthetase class 2